MIRCTQLLITASHFYQLHVDNNIVIKKLSSIPGIFNQLDDEIFIDHWRDAMPVFDLEEYPAFR